LSSALRGLGGGALHHDQVTHSCHATIDPT